MSGEVIKAEQLEAERSLVAIRAELEKLHRLSPQNLPKASFASIVSLLPTSQDILAPPQATTASASAFATLRFFRRVLIGTIFRLWWISIYSLALVGGTTVGIVFLVYLLTKLPWQTTYTGQGQGWQRHSDGYYYWGMPQESYTSTVQATVKTDIPEIESRDL
ncbi:hypothetical protein H072_10293 [Dactylellina haptotyla CBS 200.50]|uniref:Uncharacterized protein n=1 Tax=Dactylellina haptotyla (strain CBS 200.50) TaxID=1284197 RepID=S8A588_DACHA|nr:hypothetical protein H072_10293 [Dactylellina haptotyla CBS 200.50]